MMFDKSRRWSFNAGGKTIPISSPMTSQVFQAMVSRAIPRPFDRLEPSADEGANLRPPPYHTSSPVPLYHTLHLGMADAQPAEPADPGDSRPHYNEDKPWGPMSLCLFVAVCSLTVLATVDFILLQFFQQHPSQSQPANDDIKAAHGQTSSAVTWDSKSASATRAPVQATSEASIALPNNIAPPKQFRISSDFTTQTDATIRSYVFNITRGLAAPDGYNKSMILVNGQTPGPLIEANVGDTIRVKVNNLMLDESTTIHWHGIDQRDTVWMDGVFGITQCGIPPGETFTYQFDIIDQRGTFWYHSHLSLQNTDGLYGPMVMFSTR